MCPMHSEAKQTETSEFGAEKGLLQGHARRTGGLYPKNPELPKEFQQSIFKDNVRDGVAANFLVLESFVLSAVHVGQVSMSL